MIKPKVQSSGSYVFKIENEFLDFAAYSENVVFLSAIQGSLQVGQHGAEFFGVFGIRSRQKSFGLCQEGVGRNSCLTYGRSGGVFIRGTRELVILV